MCELFIFVNKSDRINQKQFSYTSQIVDGNDRFKCIYNNFLKTAWPRKMLNTTIKETDL